MSSSSSSSSGTPCPSVNPDSRNGTPATSAPASPATLTWTDTLSDDEEKPQERPVVKNGPRNAPHDGPATGPNIRGPHFPALKPQMNMTQAICYYFKSLSDSGLYPESAIPEMAQIAANRYIAEAKKTNPPVWTSVPLVPPRPQGQEQPQPRAAQPRAAQPANRAPKPRAAQDDFQEVPAKTPKTHGISDVLATFAFHEGLEVKVVESPGITNFLRVTDRENFVLPRWKSVTRTGRPWSSNLFQTRFLSPMLNAPFMIELNQDGTFRQWVLTTEDKSHVVPCDLATVIDTHNANILG